MWNRDAAGMGNQPEAENGMGMAPQKQQTNGGFGAWQNQRSPQQFNRMFGRQGHPFGGQNPQGGMGGGGKGGDLGDGRFLERPMNPGFPPKGPMGDGPNGEFMDRPHQRSMFNWRY